MSEYKRGNAPRPRTEAVRRDQPAARMPKKAKKSGIVGRIIRRFFLVLFTVIILVVVALAMAANLVFKGPSPAARNVLTMTLLEPSATKWIPALFIGEDAVQEIRSTSAPEMEDVQTDTSQIVINRNNNITGGVDEWADYPDGIRIDEYKGKTFNAHIMVVRDPAQVYLGLSNYNGFSRNVPGKRLNVAMEDEGALAAVNAGAFFDNGTSDPSVGSTPEGLVYSGGKCAWSTGAPPNATGFAGFNKDDILVVTKENLTQSQADQLNIRDGCCFGPALIINSAVNQEVYSSNSGYNPRTAIGQRADGAVIFVCADGRQAGSMGATYKDIIDIMVGYGAVNACNMDGGSSTVMFYRDNEGRYGEAGKVQMINSYSVLQSEPRRMPDYWMVRPAE